MLATALAPGARAQLNECLYTELTFEELSADSDLEMEVVPDGTIYKGIGLFNVRWIRNTYLDGVSGYTVGAVSGDTVITNATDAPLVLFDQFESFELKELTMTPAYNGEKYFLRGYISSDALQYSEENFINGRTPETVQPAWRTLNRFEVSSHERGDNPTQGQSGTFPYDGPRDTVGAGVAVDNIVIGRGACGCGHAGEPICGGAQRCMPGLTATVSLCLPPSNVQLPEAGLSRSATIALSVVCVTLAALACCLLAALCVHRRRRQRHWPAISASAELPVYSPPDCPSGSSIEMAPPAFEKAPAPSLGSSGHSAASESRRIPPHRVTSGAASQPRLPTASMRSLLSLFSSRRHDSSRAGASGAPIGSQDLGCVPTVARKMAHLEAQLKQLIGQCQGHFAGLRLLPGTATKGGQSIVIAATAPGDASDHVVKFYLSRDDFLVERAVSEDDTLRAFLPHVSQARDCDDASQRCCAPDSSAMPCFMVLERGLPLRAWVAAQRPDFYLRIGALLDLARQLAALHAAGYVHRDVKPANVLYVPSRSLWSFIDFGAAARAHATAPVALSIRYAAPEVVMAYSRQEAEVVADCAADVFSFGLLTAELLTQQPMFAPGTAEADIAAAAAGERSYPWEDGGLAPSLAADLGFAKPAFISMVQRDPAARPSMNSVVAAWERALDPGAAPGSPTPSVREPPPASQPNASQANGSAVPGLLPMPPEVELASLRARPQDDTANLEPARP